MEKEKYSAFSGAITRRTALKFLGTGGSALLAGCPSVSLEPTDHGTKYRLQAIPIRSSLHEHFRWKPDTPWGDHQNRIVDRLVDGESVTTTGYTVTPIDSWGSDERASPRFVEHDGDYYQLVITDTKNTTIDRWLFWFDKVSAESIPDDATVLEGKPESLSSKDDAVFDEARMKIHHHGNYLDLEDRAPRPRGFVYRQHDTAESSFVPDPPFTYLKITKAGETHFFKAVAEQVQLEEQAHVYRAKQVATSKSELEEYIHSEIIDADLASGDLNSDERAILNEVIENPAAYTERTPLPEEFQSLLDQFGLGSVDPNGSYTSYSNTYFRYENNYYEMVLIIKQSDVSGR